MSDSDDTNKPQEPVQGYLDLLLTSVTETPEIQSDATTTDSVEKNLQQSVIPESSIAPPDNVHPFTGSTRGVAGSSVHALPANPKERRRINISNNRSHAKPSQLSNPKSPLPLAKSELMPELVINPDVEREQRVKPSSADKVWVNGRPLWAQDRFECLLFGVAGLTLAVPLVELGIIYPITHQMTPLTGQTDCLMGSLPIKQGSLRIIDTPKVVMPECYQQAMKDNFQYVISIKAMDWGLAADWVFNTMTLSSDSVSWRGKHSKRRWLAGTVMEHSCTLVDVGQLAAMLKAESANNHGKR